MARMPANNEQMLEATFPNLGLDLTPEFEQQAPKTTPVATNVRGFEAMTFRARGGSRSGTKPFIDERLPL